MAIYTKLRHRRVVRLYADRNCYQDGVLVQVWTVVEGERTPFKRFISDLIADQGLSEILDTVRAQAKEETGPDTRISFWP